MTYRRKRMPQPMRWALCAAVVLVSTSLWADTFLYELTGGGNNISFTVSVPTTCTAPDAVCFDGVPVTVNGAESNYLVSLFDPANFGDGFQIGDFNSPLVDLFGVTMFTGTRDDPTLVTGLFSLTDFGDGSLTGDDPDGTWAVKVTAVPEPASLLLMLSGVGGFVLRRTNLAAKR